MMLASNTKKWELNTKILLYVTVFTYFKNAILNLLVRFAVHAVAFFNGFRLLKKMQCLCLHTENSLGTVKKFKVEVMLENKVK